ncbi:hypothetical protein [Paraburkholderia sp.]|uniref:hypothetical protein n=1 Tax=Paraburkholderia sp. TaxID=1926495 RepID=UPI0039E5850D
MEGYLERRQGEKQKYDNWLRSLQPGQGAVFGSPSAGYTLFTVERLTRTQIIGRTSYEREMRFRRSDGRQVGRDFGPRLVKVTPEIRDAMDFHRLRSWLVGIERDREKLTLARLKAMKKAFDRVVYEEHVAAATQEEPAA